MARTKSKTSIDTQGSSEESIIDAKEEPIVVASAEDTKMDYVAEEIHPVFSELKELMKGTQDEIMRCNDYVEAGMDSNGTWKTNRKEWYTYRYLLRQVPLQSGFPLKYELPERPLHLEDE